MKRVVLIFFIILSLIFICNSQQKRLGSKDSEQSQRQLRKLEINKQNSSQISAEEEKIEYTRLGVPKIVWTYWNKQLQEDDHYLNIFVENRKKFIKGWTIRELNQVTVWYWLNQVPDFDGALNRPEFKNEGQAKLSDLIRFTLLKHFGGVYMDFTSILVENFDWIENLDQQQAIDNRFGDGPDVFFMYNSDSTQTDSAFDPETGHRFLTNPSLELFFVIARPKSKFLQEMFDYFIEGRKKSYELYGNSKEKSVIVDTRIKQNTKTGSFKGKYFEVSISAMIIIQKKQRQLDELFANGTDKVQRYAIKEYKIWTMGTNTSAFYYHSFKQVNFILALTQSDVTLLKNQDFFPRYYIKLISLTSKMLKNYLITDKKTLDKLPCKWDYLILQNSILNRYLLSNYNKTFTYNPFVTNPFGYGCIDMKKSILNSSTRKVDIQWIITQYFLVIIFTLISVALILRFSPKTRNKLRCLLGKDKQFQESTIDSFELDKRDTIDH